MLSRAIVCLIVLLGSVLRPNSLPGADPQPKKPPAVIVSPKEGSEVERMQEVEGQLHADEGWPVLFVQPILGEEPWWVQPLVKEVKDGAFTLAAHFGNEDTKPGTKFRVVIVVAKNKKAAEAFKAGMNLDSLPAGLPRSAIITVERKGGQRGGALSKAGTLSFGGQTWEVKRGRRLGPGPNDWSHAAENVWLDDEGQLHLAITRGEGGWQCAEVVGSKSLGYGEYRWVITGDLPALDPRTVLGLFLYETNQREIDFELSRWGDPKKASGQFVVQPYKVKENIHRFDTAQAKVLTVSLFWDKAVVRGRCWEGADMSQKPLADWTYTGRHIPPPGKERPRANLWLFEGKPPPGKAKQEVVIRSFYFERHPPAEGPPIDR